LPAGENRSIAPLPISDAENALESARQIDSAARGLSNEILIEQFETVMLDIMATPGPDPPGERHAVKDIQEVGFGVSLWLPTLELARFFRRC
jgi:hypothetical protein